MAQVFISHARENRPHAEALAAWLAAEGWSVWWDAHLVGGTSFRTAIARELESATCVIVLWSADSIASHWVMDEAQSGADRDILLPILVEDIAIPLGFRQFQALKLPASWTQSDPQVQAIRRAIVAMIGPPLDRPANGSLLGGVEPRANAGNLQVHNPQDDAEAPSRQGSDHERETSRPLPSAAAPPSGFRDRWRDQLTDAAVLGIPLGLIASTNDWIKGLLFEAPWKILWIVLPLALVAWLSWRVLQRRRIRARLQFAVFLAIYCSIFALAGASDLLVWKRVPAGYDDIGVVSRNWLFPIRWGDWRYRLIDPIESSQRHFAVVVPPHAPGASREKLRFSDSRIVKIAARGGATGLAFDIAYSGSSAIDPILCAAVDSLKQPLIVAQAYERSTSDNKLIPVDSAVASPTLPCFADHPRGHALGFADADLSVRSVPLLWDNDETQPSLALQIVKAIDSGRADLPEDHLLRFAPATARAIEVYTDLEILTREPQRLHGRFVIVGESSDNDTFDTPFGRLPGAEIHAMAANALLAGKTIARPPAGASAVVVFASCYLLTLVAARGYSTRVLTYAAVGAALFILALAVVAIRFMLVWLDVVYALTAIWILVPLLVWYRRTVEDGPR